MSIEQTVMQSLRELPVEKQMEVMDFVEFLRQKQTSKQTRRNPIGMFADLKVSISEEEIDDARRDVEHAVGAAGRPHQVGQTDRVPEDVRVVERTGQIRARADAVDRVALEVIAGGLRRQHAGLVEERVARVEEVADGVRQALRAV